LFDRTVYSSLRFIRLRWKHIRDSLKSKQQRIEALHQCVMKIPSDANSLIDARLKSNIKLPFQLMNPVLIGRPQQQKKCSRTEDTKPVGLVVAWSDRKIQKVSRDTRPC